MRAPGLISAAPSWRLILPEGRELAATAKAAASTPRGTAVIADTLVTFNFADGGKKGGEGLGGGIMIAGGTAELVGTTDVVNNVASTSGNDVGESGGDIGPPVVA